MHLTRTERDSGNTWSEIRPPEKNDLVVGIAQYGRKRQMPVNETTDIPSIPQDAA